MTGNGDQEEDTFFSSCFQETRWLTRSKDKGLMRLNLSVPTCCNASDAPHLATLFLCCLSDLLQKMAFLGCAKLPLRSTAWRQSSIRRTEGSIRRTEERALGPEPLVTPRTQQPQGWTYDAHDQMLNPRRWKEWPRTISTGPEPGLYSSQGQCEFMSIALVCFQTTNTSFRLCNDHWPVMCILQVSTNEAHPRGKKHMYTLVGTTLGSEQLCHNDGLLFNTSQPAMLTVAVRAKLWTVSTVGKAGCNALYIIHSCLSEWCLFGSGSSVLTIFLTPQENFCLSLWLSVFVFLFSSASLSHAG